MSLLSEQDALDLLLHAGNLSPDFYRLSTRLAGDILLMFSNYRIKTVAVPAPELVGDDRSADFVLETYRGNAFRVFYEREAAVGWLVGG